MVLDMFRFKMSLAQTNGGKQVLRNGSLDSKEGTGPEMQRCRYLGSIRLRMVLKAREQTRCPKRVYIKRSSPRTKP